VLLGNVYRRANENVDDGEYIHLANLYGLGCVRLSKLLKIRSPSSKGRLDSYISWCIDEAIRQFWRENVGEEYCRRNLHPGNN
jgi:DNA-directed RNA polymerase specialized sigma subunit